MTKWGTMQTDFQLKLHSQTQKYFITFQFISFEIKFIQQKQQEEGIATSKIRA